MGPKRQVARVVTGPQSALTGTDTRIVESAHPFRSSALLLLCLCGQRASLAGLGTPHQGSALSPAL